MSRSGRLDPMRTKWQLSAARQGSSRDVEGTYTVYSPADQSFVYGRALTVTEAADVMLTAGPITDCAANCGAGCGSYELRAAEDVGRLLNNLRSVPAGLRAAARRLAGDCRHGRACRSMAPCSPVATDEDYVALIKGAEISRVQLVQHDDDQGSDAEAFQSLPEGPHRPRRDQHSQHQFASLARVDEAGEPLH